MSGSGWDRDGQAETLNGEIFLPSPGEGGGELHSHQHLHIEGKIFKNQVFPKYKGKLDKSLALWGREGQGEIATLQQKNCMKNNMNGKSLLLKTTVTGPATSEELHLQTANTRLALVPDSCSEKAKITHKSKDDCNPEKSFMMSAPNRGPLKTQEAGSACPALSNFPPPPSFE